MEKNQAEFSLKIWINDISYVYDVSAGNKLLFALLAKNTNNGHLFPGKFFFCKNEKKNMKAALK